jgi:hypothetical protein
MTPPRRGPAADLLDSLRRRGKWVLAQHCLARAQRPDPYVALMKPLVQRGIAGLLGIGLLAAALAGTGLVLFGIGLAAQIPDPLVADGDPCCWHPDTWGEVATGSALGLVYLMIVGMLFAGAAAMLRWAWVGRWLSLRGLSWISAGCLTLGVAVAGIGLIPKVVDDTDDPDCSSFALRPQELRSPDEDRRLSMAEGIAECGLLVNVRLSRVEAILGRPLSKKPTTGPGRGIGLDYPNLTLLFENDRLVEATAGRDP